MKRLLFLSLLATAISSCATEKVNSGSPAQQFMGGYTAGDDTEASVTINLKENVNASEITNLISSFPKLRNTAVNNEVDVLKYTLQNYLYAVEAGNTAGKKRSIKQLEHSYKKIQKLRKYLKHDDDDILNRYLVRFKTNITAIEDSVNGKK